jgi:hypothetical protein
LNPGSPESEASTIPVIYIPRPNVSTYESGEKKRKGRRLSPPDETLMTVLLPRVHRLRLIGPQVSAQIPRFLQGMQEL